MSMPWFGLLSFLRDLSKTKIVWRVKSVNALVRATLISTGLAIYVLDRFGIVSMPWFGLLSFLPEGGYRMKKFLEGCQCPGSGYSHFYICIAIYGVAMFSVNALVRATLISTMYKDVSDYQNYSVNALVRATLISTKRFIQIK